MIVYKGYVVTDGNEHLLIVTTGRAKATGAFIARFGRRIDWAIADSR